MNEQYLAFRVGEHEYATSVDTVLEVRTYDATRQAPTIFIAALQQAIPVVNLRSRMALGAFPERALPAAIVLDADGTLIAVAVDRVTELLALQARDISDAKPRINGLHVVGVAAVGARRVFVVDLAPLACEVSRCVH